MTKYKFALGAEIDLLTEDEVGRALDASLAKAEVERVKGVKWMRLPETLYGTPSGGAITLGESKGQILGPKQGYNWSIRRLVVNGLTSGTTPDFVNLYRSGVAGQPLWQFNGNNFGYTFGNLELVLLGGETLALASVGTFAATGQIVLSGEFVEVPAELMGKLL